jgi:16S rRNA (uracil1498-N3)-methyltransferase
MEPAYFIVDTKDFKSPVFQITGTEGYHAVRVRRVKEKERLVVTDGLGQVANVEVLTVGPGDLITVKIIETKIKVESQPRITVAQALAKGERSELAVELLTEVGVDEIIPWQANRCVVKWDSKSGKGEEKWKQITKESSKQSRRAFFPVIKNFMNSKELAEAFKNYPKVVVLDPDAEDSFIKSIQGIESSVLLIIGPEGGIDETEYKMFSESGASFATLGESILRTSSAGAIATAIVLANTRWVK